MRQFFTEGNVHTMRNAVIASPELVEGLLAMTESKAHMKF
jgi:hypothetical protein